MSTSKQQKGIERPMKCFVIMPFAERFAGVWETVIRPTLQNAGHDAKRGDDFFTPGVVIESIMQAIQNADFIVADLTDRNPNVYYELGLAHALGKTVILLTQSISDLPFDLQHRRVIHYSDTVAGASSLAATLRKYLVTVSG